MAGAIGGVLRAARHPVQATKQPLALPDPIRAGPLLPRPLLPGLLRAGTLLSRQADSTCLARELLIRLSG